MADRIATAVLELTTDATSLNKTLAAAGDEAKRISRTSFADAGKDLERFGGQATNAIGTLKSLSGALGVTLSIGGLVAFGADLLRTGDDIVKMADQLSMGTDEIQRLQYIAGQTNTPIEALVSATQNLQQRIGAGDTGLMAAVAHLGINFDQLKQQTPYQQLITLGTAVGGLQDPTDRANTAAAVFGKTWREIVPAILANMKKLADEAPVMSDAMTRSLASANQELNRSKAVIKVWASEGISWVYQFVNKFSGWCFSLVATFYDTLAGIGKVAEKIPGVSAVWNKLGFSVQSLTESAAWWRAGAKSLLETHDELSTSGKKLATDLDTTADKMARLRAEANALATGAIKPLTAEQEALVLQFDKGGLSASEIAKKFAEVGLSSAVSEAAIQRTIDAHKKAVDAATKHAQALDEIKAAQIPLTKEQQDAVVALQKQNGSMAEMVAATGAHESQIRAYIKTLEDQKKLEEAIAAGRAVMAKEFTRILAEQVKAQEIATDRINAGFTGNQAAIVKAYEETDKILAKLDGESLADKLATIHVEMEKRRAALDENNSNYQTALAGIDALENASAREATQAWIQHIDDVNAKLPTLGHAFRDVLKDLPGILEQAFTGGGGLAGAGKAIGAKVGAAIGDAIGRSLAKEAGQKIGEEAGAAIGGSIGGAIAPIIGQAIGACIGIAVAYAIDKLGHHAEKDVFKTIGAQWGVAISDGLKTQIADQAKKSGDEVAAEFLSLGKVIDEAGGVTKKSMGKWTKALLDAFATARWNAHYTTDDLQKTFDDVFPKLSAIVQKEGGVWSGAFQELIDQARAFGLELDDVNALLKTQATTIGTAVAGELAPLTAKYGELTGKITEARQAVADAGDDSEKLATAQQTLNGLLDQQTAGAQESAGAIDRMGKALLESLNAGVARGLDQLELMDQLGPGLDALVTLEQNLGNTAHSGAVQALIDYRAKITANKELVQAATMEGDAYSAMINLGVRDTDALLAMQQQGVANYQALIAAGFTETEALAQIKNGLLAAKQANEQFGIPIDANTQKLIDQAAASGVLGTTQKSAMDRTADAMEHVSSTLDRLADKLIGLGPAAEKGAKGIGDAFRDFTIDVPVRVHGEWPTGGTPVPGTAIPQAVGSTGIVTRPTLFLAGEAGPEEFAFSGARRSLAGGGMDAAAPAPDVTFNITTVDKRGFAQMIEEEIEPQLSKIWRRGGARRTSTQASLGLPPK